MAAKARQRGGAFWARYLEQNQDLVFLTDGKLYYCHVAGTFIVTQLGRGVDMEALGYDREDIIKEFERRGVEPVEHDSVVKDVLQ